MKWIILKKEKYISGKAFSTPPLALTDIIWKNVSFFSSWLQIKFFLDDLFCSSDLHMN